MVAQHCTHVKGFYFLLVRLTVTFILEKVTAMQHLSEGAFYLCLISIQDKC